MKNFSDISVQFFGASQSTVWKRAEKWNEIEKNEIDKRKWYGLGTTWGWV